MKKLPREFYARDTVTVAKELLGKYLIHMDQNIKRIGKIVEVEAYLGAHDLAAHASKGLTKRNSTLFGPPGHAYVYLIYGIHHCMNTVTEKEGVGTGVLLRALEPIQNLDGKTNGPGLLTKAMHVDLRYNKQDLISEILYLAEPEHPETPQIIASPRIGVHYAKEWALKPLRFHIAGNRFVSRK